MKDIVGAGCSGLCIVHCLALPVAIAVGLPVAGLSIVTGEWVHIALGTVVIVLAVLAFPAGWRRHKRLLPLNIAGLGVVLMLGSIVAPEELEAYMAGIAGLSLITAHLLNRHLLLYRDSI